MNDPSAAAADLGSIVKAYDVRGVAGVDLTVPIARALGAAFADHLEDEAMIVAHDMRLSSPELSEAFTEGAVRRGSVVAFTGLSSTDQLYCASGLHRAAGAMFTASHNPAPDNGIKMCLSGARPISRDTGLSEIRDRAEAYLDAGEIPVVGTGRREELETLADYVDTMLSLVPMPTERPLRVVVDAANAMAGHTMPAVARKLEGIEVIPLYFELDGTFPNHEANPLDPENLRDLQALVRAEGADMGLAFDGDADRCFVVDERGEAVPPSAITAIIARREIARARAAGEEEPVVVANLVSSRIVQDVVDAAGGRRVRSQVGHSLIKAIMAREDAVFGGEHSAHYYFRDFSFADSGMLAALHVLAALRETDGPLSQLMEEYDPYSSSGEINSRVADAQASREAVREHVRSVAAADGHEVEIDDLDGMTVTHWDIDGPAEDRWWFSLRSSNTEPLLRLNVEAEESATMERVRDEILGIVRLEDEDVPWAHPDVLRAKAERESSREDAPVQDVPVAEDAEPSTTPPSTTLPTWLRERIVCPVCQGALSTTGGLVCADCGRAYRVEHGIPVLIAEG